MNEEAAALVVGRQHTPPPRCRRPPMLGPLAIHGRHPPARTLPLPPPSLATDRLLGRPRLDRGARRDRHALPQRALRRRWPRAGSPSRTGRRRPRHRRRRLRHAGAAAVPALLPARKPRRARGRGEEVRWGLFQVDDDGPPIAPLAGLHESVLETDPTEREMRPRTTEA